MMDVYGFKFAKAIVALSEAKWLCMPFQLPEGEPPVSREHIEKAAAAGIHHTREACILADMDSILPELDRLSQLIWPQFPGMPKAPLPGIAQAINHLISRLQDELQSQHFFHLSQSDVRFYIDIEPFGPEVLTKFPKAVEDISEAGKCIALQRPTACVFHLMRVLELGVQTLGKKLKVKIDPQKESWHQIILHVNKNTEALPSKTTKDRSKKSSYAEASAHLQSVRLAWRNEVMHPKQTYTRQEAFDIFNASRVFMASLAKIV